MEKKFIAMWAICLMLVLMVASVSATDIRPMNQRNHPGLDNPYHPPEDGPNHVGSSDYGNVWNGISELCEQDNQMRPANQGKNIPRFYACNHTCTYNNED